MTDCEWKEIDYSYSIISIPPNNLLSFEIKQIPTPNTKISLITHVENSKGYLDRIVIHPVYKEGIIYE